MIKKKDNKPRSDKKKRTHLAKCPGELGEGATKWWVEAGMEANVWKMIDVTLYDMFVWITLYFIISYFLSYVFL